MAVEAVRNYSVNNQQATPVKKDLKPEKNTSSTPEVDKKNRMHQCYTVGATALAALGVLGMADILICKGKHINKITGKDKEFEEVLTRATTAESRAAVAETQAATLEAEATKVKEQLNDIIKGIREVSGYEDLNPKYCGGWNLYSENHSLWFIDKFGLNMNARPYKLRNGGSGNWLLRYAQRVWGEGIEGLPNTKEEKMKFLDHLRKITRCTGFDFFDKIENVDNLGAYYDMSSCGLDKPIVTLPAVVHEDGTIVMKGMLVR